MCIRDRFSAGRLTSAQFNVFQGLLNDQVNFQRISISFATAEQEKLLREKLSSPVVKEIGDIEQMVKDKGANAELGYSAEDLSLIHILNARLPVSGGRLAQW